MSNAGFYTNSFTSLIEVFRISLCDESLAWALTTATQSLMAEYNRQESEETIHQKTGCVRDQLKVFITQLNEKSESEPTVPGLSVAAVTDASERFKLWAGSVGAFLGPTRKLSLDYRLSGTPEIRYEILRQLEDILGATHDRKLCQLVSSADS